jgi:uncharacterized protein
MRAVIPGGSGQVGTILARAFHRDGHDAVVLSRRPHIRPWRVVEWDGATLGDWQCALGGSESNAPSSWRFSIEVARAWERAFDDAVTTATRKVTLRSAMTLSPDAGGVFDTLLRLVRRGLGGTAGNGRQFMSWIHYEDFVAAVRWLIERHEIDGVVNIASPNPLPNAEFMRVLREAYGVPFGLPAPDWMLEIGAAFMRTETELVLKSRRVAPRRLLEHGFTFKFPSWADAAADLCHRRRLASCGSSRTA